MFNINKLSKDQSIHFIGIGGIGLSAMAKLCKSMGYSVQGSDIVENDMTRSLQENNIKIFIGHNSGNIQKNIHLVVFSSAISVENPEFIAAKKANITLISRADMLAQLMKKKSCICISGTHGKTTTASMISWILSQGKDKPTSIIGGIDSSFQSNIQIGTNEWMVVEADESDKTFIKLPSKISVITNIDYDHIENYGSIGNLEDSFVEYANNIQKDGYIIFCKDDRITNKVSKNFSSGNPISYGQSASSTVQIKNIFNKSGVYQFTIEGKIDHKRFYIKLNINRPGIYNIYNATAAAIVGILRNISHEMIQSSLYSYTGVYRRFSEILQKNGVAYYDDYAHHPTEINQLLSSAKKLSSGRVISIFQPHRHSRVMSLYKEFCSAFIDTDALILLPIYSAGERENSEMDYNKFITDINSESKVETQFIERPEELIKFIRDFAKPGDLVLFIGAGDINIISSKICQNL
jgi:UDP-N-acetylmuramate--alanine ligase